MKLCTDCRFASRGFWQRLFGARVSRFARCHHPRSAATAESTASVNGRFSDHDLLHCSTMREFGCGIEAALFEPRTRA